MSLDDRSFKGLSRFLAPSAGGPIADRAVTEKLITSEQLQECVAEQDRSGRPLDEILVDRGYLKPEEVTRLRAPAVPTAVLPWLSNPDRVLGHYILISLLGTGGMAEVWKAWDRSIGRWVAVKYLKVGVGHPTQRIEREGRMAGQLSHPSVISIFERGFHNGRAYLVMPFVDGAPPKMPLPPREAARLALDVARALAHAHEMGVIHRDVKPANILVEAGGRVVLADFGLAILDDTATSRWAMSGTPEYASPEQIRGDPLDVRTDIYSLGATMYHMLAGRPPYTGAGPEEITEKVLKTDPIELGGKIPKPLAAIVRKAMARERDRRYATVGELAAELESWIERSRPGIRLKPIWVVVAVLSTVVPWATTLLILSHLQQQDERRQVLQALRDGERKLTQAERRRADPGSSDLQVEQSAREALAEFTMALRWSGGEDAEARYGMGRSLEMLGDVAGAEASLERASTLQSARSALAWLWARRLLEGRKDRDWKARILKDVSPPHPARLLAEGSWEPLLQYAALADQDNDTLLLAQAAAAIELQRWDDAAVRLDRFLRVRPRDATAHFYRGVALMGKGDRAGATAAWAEAVKCSPTDRTLQAEIAKRSLIRNP